MQDASNRYTAPHWHKPGCYTRTVTANDRADPWGLPYSPRTPIEHLRDDILGRLGFIEYHAKQAARVMRNDPDWRPRAFRDFKHYQMCRGMLLRQLAEVNAAILEARTRRGIQANIIEPLVAAE